MLARRVCEAPGWIWILTPYAFSYSAAAASTGLRTPAAQ
jgi:hypothetical protein